MNYCNFPVSLKFLPTIFFLKKCWLIDSPIYAGFIACWSQVRPHLLCSEPGRQTAGSREACVLQGGNIKEHTKSNKKVLDGNRITEKVNGVIRWWWEVMREVLWSLGEWKPNWGQESASYPTRMNIPGLGTSHWKAHQQDRDGHAWGAEKDFATGIRDWKESEPWAGQDLLRPCQS